MTVTTTLTLFALLFYSLAIFCAFRLIQSPERRSGLIAYMLLGLITHWILMISLGLVDQGMAFNLKNALLWVSGLTMTVLWVMIYTHKIALLSLILGPATLIALGLTLVLSKVNTTLLPWTLASHILTSIFAYVLFGFAAAQALLYAYQEGSIRNHRLTQIVRSLPPLKRMEELLFSLIRLGFVVLSLALLSGFFFLEDLFAQHLAHKTFFSILSWFVFLGLLMGRHGAGWRGQVAVRWTLIGYLLLALGFVGSRFVLEYILL